jgi:hypothetical protein
MNYKSEIDKLLEIESEIRGLKKNKIKLSEKIFNQFIKSIFIDNPKLESFSWPQYTPYYNDDLDPGFKAYLDYLSVNGQPVEEANWYSKKTITTLGTWNPITKEYDGQITEENPNYDQELSDLADEISLFLENFEDIFYLHRFGDHAEVTITKGGVQICEIDHE